MGRSMNRAAAPLSTVVRITVAATAIVTTSVAAPAWADAASLDRALARIPENAVSFVAIPSLKGLSDDLAQLVEATGQGGLLSMGRPIDLLKAQLGVGANLDEKGPAVAYFPAVGNEMPVLIVPVTEAEAFLKANLKPAPDQGEQAYTTGDGKTVFVRAFDGCVAVAPSAASLPSALPERGIAERFRARLQPAESAWLERADLVAWGSRDALHAAVERARAQPAVGDAGLEVLSVPVAAMAGQQEAIRKKALEVGDMLADGLVVLDIDPLGVFLGTVGVAEPGTALAALTAGGDGRPARFDRLPKTPFYLALSADVDGLGGAAKFGELMDLAGIARSALPEWFFAEGGDIRSVQLAAFPSKLGVAIGGALNDSALFIGSRNPARTLARVKQSIEALSGESDGIRREAAWNAEKKLKSGDTVIAFEVKETVVDATKRPPLDYERLIKQFVLGARGLNGLVKQRDDGLVVTFSQRPDVYGRALEAAAGTSSLAQDETVRSVEEWLPAERDLEAMIGIGQLANLVSQIASSFVSEEQLKASMPQIDKDAAPVAVALELAQGRARFVAVIPADVIKAAAAAGASAGARPRAAPPQGAQP